MVRAAAIAWLLSLTACGDIGLSQKLSDAQRDEVTDLAEDAADDQLGSKMRSLEERVDQLETDKNDLELRVRALERR